MAKQDKDAKVAKPKVETVDLTTEDEGFKLPEVPESEAEESLAKIKAEREAEEAKQTKAVPVPTPVVPAAPQPAAVIPAPVVASDPMANVTQASIDPTQVTDPNHPLFGIDANKIKLIIEMYKAEEDRKANLTAEEEDETVVARSLTIKQDKRYGMYVVHREGGGRIPVILQGHWDNYNTLERNIQLYGEGKMKPSPLQRVRIERQAQLNQGM